jgi:hypothetical protein
VYLALPVSSCAVLNSWVFYHKKVGIAKGILNKKQRFQVVPPPALLAVPPVGAAKFAKMFQFLRNFYGQMC